MHDQTPPEQASPEVQARVQASFERQGLMRHLEAVGTVIKSGRTLTVCQLEVFSVQDRHRTLIAAGQQTLICMKDKPEQ